MTGRAACLSARRALDFTMAACVRCHCSALLSVGAAPNCSSDRAKRCRSRNMQVDNASRKDFDDNNSGLESSVGDGSELIMCSISRGNHSSTKQATPKCRTPRSWRRVLFKRRRRPCHIAHSTINNRICTAYLRRCATRDAGFCRRWFWVDPREIR